MHAAPEPPRRPVLAASVGLALLTGLAALSWAASVLTQGAAGSPPVPLGSSAPSPEVLGPAQACERAVWGVLMRYGNDLASGAASVVMITPEESDALDAVPPAYDAYLTVTSEYTSLVGPWGERLPVGEAMEQVMPQVRRVCQRAG